MSEEASYIPPPQNLVFRREEEEEPRGGRSAAAKSTMFRGTARGTAATRKSPYDPCPRDVQLTLVHCKTRCVVAALDVGPEGAPYPDRRVVAGDEVGWEDNGTFVPDPMFPRRVRLGHPKSCGGGFEMGPPGAAYPERMTVRLRWDFAEAGSSDEIEGRPGAGRRFVLRQHADLKAPFGGLSHDELKAQHCRNLSAAAYMTLQDIYGAASRSAARLLESNENLRALEIWRERESRERAREWARNKAEKKTEMEGEEEEEAV